MALLAARGSFLLSNVMNYYRRYMGDYMRDTMHLSMVEHGAYSLLLDAYYATGKPLQPDYESLYRVCRAVSRPEQESARKVADQFFKIASDNLRHNERADLEIGIAQATIAKQRESGVNSAVKRHSNNGSTDRSTGRLTDRSTDESINRSAIQPPTTNHQPPETKTKPLARRDKRASLGDGDVVEKIPAVGGEVEVKTTFVAELERLYPAVDVPQTLREIRGWNLANPTRQKTPRGMGRHINSWMARVQNG